MDREEKARLRAEEKKRQAAIANGWKEIATNYPAVLEDFFGYTEGLAKLYRYWADEQSIGDDKLDDHEVVQYLQRARVCDMVRTYITSRIDQDVAQPIKKSK